MKLPWLLPAITIIVAPSAFAAPTKTLAAFRSTAKSVAGRHIMAKPKGGLILGSTMMDNKEIFTLVDLNGGALKTGDAVQVTFPSGNGVSYWIEDGKNVTRTPKQPTAACTFKVIWKVPTKTLQFRTASGKYLAGTGKGQDIATTPKPSDLTVFELLKNPKPAPKKK